MSDVFGGWFSFRGLAMCFPGLVLGVVIAGAVDSIWPKADVGFVVGGWVLIILTTAVDAAYRWRYNQTLGRARFFRPRAGGTFCFVPLWIICGALTASLPFVLIVKLLKR